MKLRIKKNALNFALKSIKAIAHKSSGLSFLESVHLSTIDKELILKATDLKTTIAYTLVSNELEIIEPGELVLNALSFFSAVKETPDEEILIDQQGFNAALIIEDGKILIQGADPKEFPKIPQFEDKYDIEMLGDDFKKLIKKTLFVTTNKKTRYDLDNVLVDILEDKIRFVATDGKRLAIFDRPYKAIGEVINKQLTVLAQALKQINLILSATTPETVMLSFLDRHLLFCTKEFILSTRLSDAKFPPYQKVIPSELPYWAKINRKDFTLAIKRVCRKLKKSEQDFETISLTLAFSKNEIKFIGLLGEITKKIWFNGEPFSIIFNSDFLLELLKYLTGHELRLQVRDGHSAMIISEEGYKYIVLPIKK